MAVAPGPIVEDNAAQHSAGDVADAAALPPATADEGHSSVSVPRPAPAGLDWPALEQAVAACTACGLCHGRTNTVFGVGDRRARWFFVGEGPGRQEDLQGDPFVGPAGKLLDNMIGALGLQRGENTYIANVVKCRPLAADGGDRPPAAEEVATCLPFLQRQIDLVQPDVIVALGKSAAVSLLGLPADTPVASLRGQLHAYRGVPLVVTYHPAYLLRQPADKAKAWRDLCLAMTAHAAGA
jgi:DNA polymerase